VRADPRGVDPGRDPTRRGSPPREPTTARWNCEQFLLVIGVRISTAFNACTIVGETSYGSEGTAKTHHAEDVLDESRELSW